MSFYSANSLDRRCRSVVIDLGCLAVMSLLASLLFRYSLFLDASLYFRDFQLFFVSMKSFLGDSFRSGEFPLWNPYVQMGTPFLADPQSGVFYPPSVLFIIFDAVKGMAVTLLFHLVICQSGFYFLARHYGFSRIASMAGAIAFGLGGWMISSGNMMTLSHSAAWVPWTILTFERMWVNPRAGNIACTSIILVMQMLSGWPEMFIMIGLVLLVRRLLIPSIMEPGWVIASVLAFVVAVGLFAPQGLATWEAFRLSDRVGGMSDSQLFEFSATAGQLRSLLFPPDFSSSNWNILKIFPDGHVPNCLSLYLGWVAILLCIVGLTGPRKHVLIWLFIAGCGAFIALGDSNPVAMYLLRVVNIFRSPEKYLFLVHFAMCMLIVAGCSIVMERIPVNLSVAVGILILFGLSVELITVNSRINLFAPTSYYNLSQIREAQIIKSSPGRLYSLTKSASNFDNVRELYFSFRNLLIPNIGAIDKIGYLNGISFINNREHALTDYMLELPPGEVLARRLGFFGVTYLVTDDKNFSDSREWNQHATRLTPYLWRLKERASYLGFPRRVLAANDGAIISVSAQTDFARGDSAFISPEYALEGGNLSGEIYGESVRPGHASAMVKTSTGGLVVLRESIYPGWRVMVDDQEAPLVQTNRFFMGTAVPVGVHRVSFDYVPTYWNLGLMFASASALILLSLVVIAVKGRSSKNHE